MLCSIAFAIGLAAYSIHPSDGFKCVKISRVIDADTVEVLIPGVHPIMSKMALRIDGVDTPESRTKKLCEKELGLKAKEFVKSELVGVEYAEIKGAFFGKFGGRVVGDLIYKDKSLSKTLIKEGLAVEYHGGTKVKDWCSK